MSDATPGVPVRSYTRTVRSRWMWVVMGTVCGIAAAFLFLQLTPTTFTATAVVNVEVVSTSPFRADRPASNVIDMQTEAELAGSYSTAVLAAESLDSNLDPGQIRAGTSVTADANGTVMRVRFTDTDADRARETADGLALAYLGVRRDKALDRAAQTTAAIDERLEDLASSLERALETASSTEGGSTARVNAEADATLLRSEMDSLVSERVSLFNLSSDAGQLITPATATSTVVAPSRVTVMAGGALAGLVLGIVLAFARERFARTVSSAPALESLVMVPVWTADHDSPSDPWGTTRELFTHAVDQLTQVSVVPLGRNQETTFTAKTLAEAVQGLSDSCTVTLVPPGTREAEVLAAVRKSGAVVLVVSTDYRKASLLQSLLLMEQVGATIVGIVLSEGNGRDQEPRESSHSQNADR